MIFGKLFKRKFTKKVKKGAFEPTIIFKSSKSKPIKKVGKRLKLPKSIKHILFGLFFLGAAIGIFAVILYLINLDYFKVSKFQIFGHDSISDNSFDTALGKYKGKSIWLVDLDDVKYTLHQSFFTIERIQIIKYLPNKIFINIKEREPTLIYADIAGVYLVDKNAKVIDIIYEKKINIPESRVLAARGLGDPNGLYVRDQMLLDFIATRQIGNLPKDEQDQIIAHEFDFNNIPISEKERILIQIQKQALAEIDVIVEENKHSIENTPYTKLPIVNAYENKTYKLDETINLPKLNLTKDIDNFFHIKQETIHSIIWEGEVIVKVRLDTGKTIIFSTSKNHTQQLSEYMIMIEHLRIQGKNYSVIDLSARKISVK